MNNNAAVDTTESEVEAPERIWLLVGDSFWWPTKEGDTDIEYVRSDVVRDTQAALVKALRGLASYPNDCFCATRRTAMGYRRPEGDHDERCVNTRAVLALVAKKDENKDVEG